jgi:hypothetical protein
MVFEAQAAGTNAVTARIARPANRSQGLGLIGLLLVMAVSPRFSRRSVENYATNLIQGRDLTGSVHNRSITSSRVEAEYACPVQHSVIGVTSI